MMGMHRLIKAYGRMWGLTHSKAFQNRGLHRGQALATRRVLVQRRAEGYDSWGGVAPRPVQSPEPNATLILGFFNVSL